MSTFVAGQISSFPTLILQGIFLSSETTGFFCELKIQIFNFYQRTRGNLTFLDMRYYFYIYRKERD